MGSSEVQTDRKPDEGVLNGLEKNFVQISLPRGQSPFLQQGPQIRGAVVGQTPVFWNGIPLQGDYSGLSDLIWLENIATNRVEYYFFSLPLSIMSPSPHGGINFQTRHHSIQRQELLFQADQWGQLAASVKQEGRAREALFAVSAGYTQNENKYLYRDDAQTPDLTADDTTRLLQNAGYRSQGLDFSILNNWNKKINLQSSFLVNRLDRQTPSPISDEIYSKTTIHHFLANFDLYGKIASGSDWFYRWRNSGKLKNNNFSDLSGALSVQSQSQESQELFYESNLLLEKETDRNMIQLSATFSQDQFEKKQIMIEPYERQKKAIGSEVVQKIGDRWRFKTGAKVFQINQSINQEKEDYEAWAGSEFIFLDHTTWIQVGRLLRLPSGMEMLGPNGGPAISPTDSSAGTLDFETYRSLEVGLENSTNQELLSYKIMGHRRWGDDALEFYFDAAGNYRTENFNNHTVQGLEYLASLRPWTELSLAIQGSWLQAEYQTSDGTTLKRPFVYARKFNPSLTYLPTEYFKTTLSYLYMDRAFSDKDNLLALPYFESFDLSFHYLAKAAQVTLYGQQLLDQKIPDSYGNLPAGRTLGVRLGATF